MRSFRRVLITANTAFSLGYHQPSVLAVQSHLQAHAIVGNIRCGSAPVILVHSYCLAPYPEDYMTRFFDRSQSRCQARNESVQGWVDLARAGKQQLCVQWDHWRKELEALGREGDEDVDRLVYDRGSDISEPGRELSEVQLVTMGCGAIVVLHWRMTIKLLIFQFATYCRLEPATAC